MARRRVTRRRFLKSAAAVLAPAIVPASALGAGPVIFDYSTSQQYVPVPPREQVAWRSLLGSVRSAR